MKRLLSALVFVAAATPALGCTSDDDRTDRIDIEGVDCIVVRNGFGRIQRTEGRRPVTWELARAPWSDTTRVCRLLRNGWEPFAYAGMDIAFRRPSEATDLRPRFDDSKRVIAFLAREDPS